MARLSLQSPVRRRPTQDPVFCVGLAKSGTHSLAEMLSGACRTAHEPDFGVMLALLPGVRAGQTPVGLLRDFLRERSERLGLDVEVSHLLSSFMPHLLDAFPSARYVLLVRECRAWIDSMINDQLNLREQYDWQPGQWQGAYDEYMERHRWRSFPPEEAPLRELDLYPLAAYVSFWRDEVRRVESSVPEDRLLTLGTDEIRSSVDRIADFVGVPAEDVDLSRSHAFQSPRRFGVLDRIDPAYLAARVAEAGDDSRSLIS